MCYLTKIKLIELCLDLPVFSVILERKNNLNDRNATLTETSEPICQVFGCTERLHLKAVPPMFPYSFKIYNGLIMNFI